MCAVAQTVLGNERILGAAIDSPRNRLGARRLHPAWSSPAFDFE